MWWRIFFFLGTCVLGAFVQATPPLGGSCPGLSKNKKIYIYTVFEEILGEGASLDSCIDVSNNINDKVYKVSTSVGDFALRLGSRTPYAKKRTIVRSLLGAHLQVAPKVHWADASHGVIITDWVQGELLKSLTPRHIVQIAGHLKKIHKSPMDTFSEPYTIGMRVHQRLKDIVKVWPTLEADLTPYLKVLTEIEMLLKPYDVLVITHGDLNQGNIIETPKKDVFLIDWGDSVVADAYDDLAGLAHYFHLSESDMYFLLLTYLGRIPTKKEQAKLYFKRLETLLHHGLWAYLQLHRFRDKNAPPRPIYGDETSELLSDALQQGTCMTLPDEVSTRHIAAMALSEFEKYVQSATYPTYKTVLENRLPSGVQK